MEDGTFQRGLHVAALKNTKYFIRVNGVRIQFYLLIFDTQREI